MVYIVAGATGVVGTAISKELASDNDVIIIGRDEDKRIYELTNLMGPQKRYITRKLNLAVIPRVIQILNDKNDK